MQCMSCSVCLPASFHFICFSLVFLSLDRSILTERSRVPPFWSVLFYLPCFIKRHATVDVLSLMPASDMSAVDSKLMRQTVSCPLTLIFRVILVLVNVKARAKRGRAGLASLYKRKVYCESIYVHEKKSMRVDK